MKQITEHNKERLYLSLTVAITLVFALFCIAVNLFDKIQTHLDVYSWIPHTEMFFNGVFAYLTVILWIMYRNWKKALRKQKELEDIISSINPDVLMVVDSDNRIIKCNQTVQRMFGYDVSEVVNRKAVESFIDISSKPGEGFEGHDSGTKGGLNVRTATGKKKNGDTIQLEVIMGNLEQSSGRVMLLRDITERKKAEESLKELTSKLEVTNAHLEQLAKIDPLTELLNRRGLEELLAIEVNRARREGSRLAAILLDCDSFKHVNDTLGHAVGDVVLTNIGKNLKKTLRPSDHIARVGGDEFLILLPNIRLAEAVSISERLRLSVSTSPMPVFSKNVKVTASLGVTLVPYEVSSIEEILSLTRLPLQRSKNMGKNLVSATDASSGTDRESAAALMKKMEQLLQGNCFYSVYQPIFHLADERLEGYELFARSTIEDFEMPLVFFGFSLENNILTYVDLQCLKTCIAATTALQPKARFHVNLFPSTMLATPIENLLKIFPAGMEKNSFCVEISEQQFIGDPSYFKEYAVALKESGISVAIDDLGFGRSSLESLIILEPDLIKIDRVYVDGIAHDESKRSSLERLLKILDGLNADHIAEGIETQEDLDVLKEMGVKYGQGYRWGKPARVPEAERKPTESIVTLEEVRAREPSQI